MRVPLDKLGGVLKRGASAAHDAEAPIRVAVYLDESATDFLVSCVKGSLVPQAPTAMVRVERLGAPIDRKHDTDVAIVISCGSELLEERVKALVIAGAPVVVLAESSVEVPFIVEDTPMLGLIASTDEAYLRERLARWVLDRTDKPMAFAANFPFMRDAASNRVIADAALGNMVTGALVFIPGADYPVMAVQQVGMLVELAGIHGKGLKMERTYEIAGVLAGGLVLRAATRAVVARTPRFGFVVKALVGGFGTYAMGKALVALYESDVDYSVLNDCLSRAAGSIRAVVGAHAQEKRGKAV